MENVYPSRPVLYVLKWRKTAKKQKINKFLSKEFGTSKRGKKSFFFPHKFFKEKYFDRDGIHLNQDGNRCFYNSIKKLFGLVLKIEFRDTYILGQNVCSDSNVQHEQIISPLQRNYEGGHIVLIWVFLLILFILKQPCSGCNSFILWYRLRYLVCRCITIRCFVMDHYDLHIRFQGQIIEFREFSYPGCKSFILWYKLMIFDM